MEVTTATGPRENQKPAKKPSIKDLRPKSLQKRSNYDPQIPRKLMEGICGLSSTTLVKLENDGIIKPQKVKSCGSDTNRYVYTPTGTYLH